MIELTRITTAERINGLLNHPEVRPWIAPGVEQVDISAAVGNPRNIMLMGAHGGVMFFYVQEGVYEAHTQVHPEARGPWTDSLTEAAVYWMFIKTPCYEIVTRVPQGHMAARAAARRRGLRYEFTRPKECVFMDRLVDVDIYSFRIHDWIDQAESLDKVGEVFHDLLHKAAAKHGVKTPAHDNDPNHNRYVGAAVEMLLNGQTKKAVSWYNRWAIISRHQPIVLMNQEKPVIIKIDSGFYLQYDGTNLEIRHVAA